MKAFAAALTLLLALASLAASAQQREPGKNGTPAAGNDSGKPRLRTGIGISISISPALLFPRRSAADDDNNFEAGQLLLLWGDPAIADAGPALRGWPHLACNRCKQSNSAHSGPRRCGCSSATWPTLAPGANGCAASSPTGSWT